MKVSVRLIVLTMLVHSLNAGALKDNRLLDMLDRFVTDNNLNATPLSDKQINIDRREFEKKSLEKCADCERTNLPSPPCSEGLNMEPHWVERTQGDDNSKCQCLKEYTCCPNNCNQTIEEAVEECKNGFSFKDIHIDCCGCKKYECFPCPDNPEQDCPNCTSWKRNAYINPRTQCPVGSCVRDEKPTEPTPTCNDNCQMLVHDADSCGFPTAKCQCLERPNCRPGRPAEKLCHIVQQVPSVGIYECSNDKSTCQLCFTWEYDLIPIESNEKTCNDSCEIPYVTEGTCGSYTQTCKCNEPANCEPTRPDEIECHHLEEVYSSTAFKCKSAEDHTCKPCFHWQYVSYVESKTNSLVCDSKCQRTVISGSECGSHAKECVCNVITKEQCQPDEPKNHGTCYTPKKALINDSYMCATDEKSCLQCFQWEWESPVCAAVEEKDCDPNCKHRIVKHDKCGCMYYECDARHIMDCFPEEPADNKCFDTPRQNYIEPAIYSEKSNKCHQCYNYTVTRKDFPKKDCVEEPQGLPTHCWNRWSTMGDCNQEIERCSLKGEECQCTFDKCPAGFAKLTAWSSCKQMRDICIDCSEGQENAPDKLPLKCYQEYDDKYMKVCDVKRWQKISCDRDNLDLSMCENGGVREIVFDDCGCPSAKCTKCDKLDVQLLIDGSGSITRTIFNTMRAALKTNLIPKLMAEPNNRIALTFFGDNAVMKRDLSEGLTAKKMGQYSYPLLGQTHTANALKQTWMDFQAKTREDAKKVLVVITDGNNNGGGDVEKEAKVWRDNNVNVYAIGLGNISLEGLKLISPSYYKNLDSVDDLDDEISSDLLPKMCPEMK